MPSVLAELGSVPTASLDAPAPAAAGWLARSDLGMLDSTPMQAWRLSRALPNQLEQRYTQQLSALSATEHRRLFANGSDKTSSANAW
jgi:hypothetical protein